MSSSRKSYKTLYKRYYDQAASKCFAFFPFDRNAGETWETPFEGLVSMAKPEEWDFNRSEFKKPNIKFPVLHSYLNYTFLRLQEQDKIIFSDDNAWSCFNTGLITPDEKEIYALFTRNTNKGNEDWFFKGFLDSYSRELHRFRSNLPEIATYIEHASDLVLDTSYEIEVNIGHILDDEENQERLPELLRNNRTLALSAIEGATKFIKQKVIRNYKVAIPQWYMPANRIQLLLPLCIISPDKADLALVAEKDSNAKVYRVRTALRMDIRVTARKSYP